MGWLGKFGDLVCSECSEKQLGQQLTQPAKHLDKLLNKTLQGMFWMTYYTWIDGKFYIRPHGEYTWKHLSRFPMYDELDRSVNNQRVTEMAKSGIPVSGFSEGWFLHQSWLNDPNYQLIRA